MAKEHRQLNFRPYQPEELMEQNRLMSLQLAQQLSTF